MIMELVFILLNLTATVILPAFDAVIISDYLWFVGFDHDQ